MTIREFMIQSNLCEYLEFDELTKLEKLGKKKIVFYTMA